MARSFAAASSQYAYSSSSPISTIPATLACWFYKDSNETGYPPNLMSVCRSANDDAELAIRIASSAPHKIVATSRASDFSIVTETSSGTSTGVWYHAAAVFATTTSRTAYLNASGTSGTDSSNPTSLNVLALASNYRTATPGAYFNGAIAHAAIWNVALSAAEVAQLYNSGIGADPRSVRPDALVAYWPLLNNDGDQDYWGNFHLTASGSPTYAQHPPVLMRSRPKYVILGAAGGAPTISSVTITGTRTVSNTLTANVVTVPSPVDSIAYQWEIADDGSGTNAADLSGETAQTLALTYADFASRLDANGEAYVRVGAIATEGVESSAESFSDWVRVTAGGSGVVRPIGQSVYISV